LVLVLRPRREVTNRRRAGLCTAARIDGLLPPTNLAEARLKGGETTKAEADRHAQNGLPVIREVQATGARSLAQVAAALNARGMVTARGASWAPTTVKRVLDRAG
jgi:hypothetical protein